MTSDKWKQKFQTDGASLPRSRYCFWWLKQVSHMAGPIRSITQIWIVSPHQYGIFSLVPQTSIWGGNQWWQNAGCFLRPTNTVVPHLTDTSLLWTVFLFPGESNPSYFFSIFNTVFRKFWRRQLSCHSTRPVQGYFISKMPSVKKCQAE